MHVCAKFRCTRSVQHAAYQAGTQGMREYHFEAVCADEVPENARFHRYTPNGSLSITVDNPDVQFEPGKCYYLDFQEAGI
jgi:hypothetical protein